MFKFFQIPLGDDGAAEAELNGFLGSHRIVSVERRLLEHGDRSCWWLCVEYSASKSSVAGPSRSQTGKGRIDYREVLSPEDFKVYAQLRDVRKVIAAEEGVAVYVVFTNDQLAQ